jgi:phosphatidylserine decarboxylase
MFVLPHVLLPPHLHVTPGVDVNPLEVQTDVVPGTPSTPTVSGVVKKPSLPLRPGSSLRSSRIESHLHHQQSVLTSATSVTSISGITSQPAMASPVSTLAPPPFQHRAAPGPSAAKKRRFRKSWSTSTKKSDYNFSAENDVLGIVMWEAQGATDLPRLKNSTSSFCCSRSMIVSLTIPLISELNNQ